MSGRALLEIEETNRGLVAYVFYDRREKLNSLDVDGIAACQNRVAALADMADLRCVVITGAGEKAFVGGADLDTLETLDGEGGRAFISSLHDLMRAIRDLPVPTIARVNGWCLGAGMELAAACDMRVASSNAHFGMPEVQVGIPSVIEAVLLPRLLGWGRAARLVLTGETIDATTALEWGFVEEVTAPDGLTAAVARLTDTIVAAGPGAVRRQKTLMRSWESESLDASIQRSIDLFAEACASGENTRMIQAFKAARRRT